MAINPKAGQQARGWRGSIEAILHKTAVCYVLYTPEHYCAHASINFVNYDV